MCLGSIETKQSETQTQPQKSLDEIEQEVWEFMTPAAWHESVAKKDSIFCSTYDETRRQVAEVAVHGNHDVILEVGSGTGDIVGLIDSSADESIASRLLEIPRYGIDLNADFVGFADKAHNPGRRCEYLVGDATTMVDEFWKKRGLDKKYKRPLVICVNNTLPIMPEKLRGAVVAQMLTIAGDEGRCLCTYWNGNFFSHAIMNYYKKNANLCGKFDENQHVSWAKRTLRTPSEYMTTWFYPQEVQKILRAYDVDIDTIVHDGLRLGEDHINCAGPLAIFAWFSTECTSRAKSYYDSDDAQKFYNNIWGEETIHIGRYDKLTDEDKQLSLHKQISKAQEYHESDFIELIKSKYGGGERVRILDMGCGYGGLLRRLHEADVVWSATGCDIAVKMCQQARRLNEEQGCDKDIEILEESYLDISVPGESADLVISMDALLHVGPDGQRKAINEAARILRPGGWMIFSDIMQQETADPSEMKPIYDRIHLSKMGTVSNYKDAMETVGFRKFEFVQASSTNVSNHYGTVSKVLEEQGDAIGISKEYQHRMKTGLTHWRDLGAKNIVWGFIVAQKCEKVDLESV